MRITTTMLFLIALGIMILSICSCTDDMPDEVNLVASQINREVDFNFDIRPILADRCFSCHGPDQKTRKAELRLDRYEGIFGRLSDGVSKAIVPGNLEKSLAWQRIISHQKDLMMPPPESHLTLSTSEKALFATWIKQGANWKEHWAFIPPREVQLPQDLPMEWTRYNAIDYFIQKKLQPKSLVPSVEADRERLIRRLCFDLTGLPPSLSEIEDFLVDDTENAYEKLVDRLLNSDACAERLTMEWLDVARYADSHGMHADGLRIMWPWRDWVIQAFRDNLPYDDFVRLQIAGDLLPHGGQEQKLATGFLRNHPLNSESGIVPEEYRVKYVADRTNTTATAFLGLTMECASCHDHKFDPISQKEYYQMSGFFNNVKELGMIGNDLNFGPLLLLTDSITEKEVKVLSDSIAYFENAVLQLRKKESSIKKNIDQLIVPDPIFAGEFNTIRNRKRQDGRTEIEVDQLATMVARGTPELIPGKFGNAVNINSDYDQINIKGLHHFNLVDQFSVSVWVKTEKIGAFQSVIGNIGDKNSGWRGWLFFLDSLNRPGLHMVNNLSQNYIHVVARQSIPIDEWTHVAFTYDGSANSGGVSIFIDGTALDFNVHSDRLYKNILPVKFRNYQPDPGRNIRMGFGSKYLFSETDDGVFYGAFDKLGIYDKCLSHWEISRLSGNLDDDLQDSTKERMLEDHFWQRLDPQVQKLNYKLKKLREKKYAILDTVLEVMVMEEMETPRKTFILNRGLYDDLGEEVDINTPTRIFPYSQSYPKNRLGLVEWLFDIDQPLTSRVIVNRYWQMIFGRGIVSTPHDFGLQGALPTHPELLDWLALEFRKSGWNLRHLLKQMVMAATYRQSSVIREMDREIDPKNLWLARGGSYRLPLEMIRDNALAASGLLVREVGGESVKPYQPEGLWKEKNEFSGFLTTYRHDEGGNLYRRSMYTFIRRTSPPPIMTIFDAPTRDVCTVRREVTNTPLQALVLLNDPQFIEAARVLAERVQEEGGDLLHDQIIYAFRLACGRNPTADEMNLLNRQFDYEWTKYRNSPESASAFTKIGEKPPSEKFDPVKTAAFTMVCNTMLNFDEAYMKR